MIKKLKIIIAVCIATLLAACSDPVQEEIISYVNEDLPEIAKLEEEVIGKYDSVTGENYKDDEILYDALTNEIIPDYSQLIDKLEAIQLSDKELRDIHEDYIEAANQQYSAFTKMLAAIENQDYALIEEVNGILSQSRKDMRDYQYDLKEYAEKNDVEIKE
ncbi:hypothetical protein [Metabacillus fastidiosus]|uniref:hypothetical protein n=1 Tax=Metabacillus fastidiosus TaxID=1458 RepID=UPI002E1E3DF5|nr:hypothetical protein [Metabacillus fastidiosus]